MAPNEKSEITFATHSKTPFASSAQEGLGANARFHSATLPDVDQSVFLTGLLALALVNSLIFIGKLSVQVAVNLINTATGLALNLGFFEPQRVLLMIDSACRVRLPAIFFKLDHKSPYVYAELESDGYDHVGTFEPV